MLGYDKYEEITSEYAIRSTYCDLAVKVEGDVRFLIEVKAIGKDLHDNHLRQAVDYGAKEGVDWVVLTNGVEWQAHRLRFEKPINHERIFSLDLLGPDIKPTVLLEQLFLLSREAAKGDAIERFRRRQEATSRFVLAQITLSDAVVKVIRRELRKLSPEVKITELEVADLLRTGVLKREVVEGELATAAAAMVKRAVKKAARKSKDVATNKPDANELSIPQPDRGEPHLSGEVDEV